MTMEMAPSGGGGADGGVRRDDGRSASPHSTAQNRVAEARRLVIDDIDRYRVTVDGVTVGYIDVVGTVFVALAGGRYAHAIEVCQSLVWDDAVRALARER